MNVKKKKCAKRVNDAANGMLLISYLTTLVLIIIWLFKIIINARSEYSARSHYIIKDPSNYYTEEEFCYEKYEPFIIKGALHIFDLPIEKIKKYATALLSTILISIGSFVLSGILICISKHSYHYSENSLCCASFFYVICLLGIILSLAFAIVLAYYYSKGNYNDFEDFSRCRYLKKNFRADYDFIFQIKNGYKLPITLVIITEFFNFIKFVVEMGTEDKDNKS